MSCDMGELCGELTHLREHQYLVSQRLRESLCGAQSLKWSTSACRQSVVDTLFDTLAVEDCPTIAADQFRIELSNRLPERVEAHSRGLVKSKGLRRLRLRWGHVCALR